MIMLCLTFAMEASAIAFAIFAIAGCSGRSAAENTGAAYLATAPAETAVRGAVLLPRDRSGAAPMIEAETQRMMQPTSIEQRHFNIYKNFRAILDAASDAHGSHLRTTLNRSDDADDLTCSSNGLIKQND